MLNDKQISDQIDDVLNFDDISEDVLLPSLLISASSLSAINLSNVDLEEKGVIEGADLIDEQFKQQTFLISAVSKRAADNIKIGSPYQYVDAMANLNDSYTNLLKEYYNFKKMVYDLKVIHNPELSTPNPGVTNNNLFLDGKGLSELLNKAKKESQLNHIEPKFKTENQIEEGKSSFSDPR